MTPYTNVRTSAMRQSPPSIAQGQCDVPQSVPSLDDGSVLDRINRDLLKLTQVDHKMTIVTSKPVSDVTVLFI
jgi:hypothetical protein